MAGLGAAYVTIRGDLAGLKTDLNKALDQIKGLETKTDQSTKAMTASFTKVQAAIKLMSSATLAFGAAAAGLSVAKNFLDAGIAAEKMGKSLQAALGSMNAAVDAQKFLRQESERLGLVFMDQVKSYTSLAAAARGTALEGEQTQKIFTSITTASTALGLSADETSGALNAIQQMMSKGNVQAEELRGQLAERLPGAFGMAAEAMGVTTVQLNKMLKDGEVLASDLLPKLADVLVNRYGSAATEAANLTQANMNKMITAWTDLKVVIIEDFMPAISSAFEGITNLLRLFPNLSKAVGLVRSGMLDFKDVAMANGKELNDLVNKFDPLAVKIAAIKNKIDEISKGPMSFAYQGQIQSLNSELQKLEQTQRQVANSAAGIAAAKGVKPDAWVAYYKGLEEAAEKTLPKIAGAHDDLEKTAKRAMKEAEKSAQEYQKSIESVVDEYNRLTQSADEYARLKVWTWYEKEAEILGQNNEYLIAARDLKLQEITNSGEQAKALAEVEEEYRKIILSALDYKQLQLDEKFKKDTIAIGENADALSKLSAAYKAN